VFKDAFKVGLRVLFARSHDKVTKLFGRIVKIHDGPDDCVDIETEPDGKKVEVSSLETAHAADVVLAEQKPLAPNAGTDDTADVQKFQQAVVYVVNRRGYSLEAAKEIVTKVGVDKILEAEAHDLAEDEELRTAAVADGVKEFSKPAETAPANSGTGEVVQDPSPAAAADLPPGALNDPTAGVQG
jgi:hypothetical protein